MTTLFISDLHLSPTQPALTEHFLNFMHHHAKQADALYILGDLFDAWMGDDLSAPHYPEVTQALLDFRKTGRYLAFMRGNRDFLVSQTYCNQIGAELLSDPIIRSINGTEILLSHGDLYCIDDVSYQRFRRIVQHPLIQAAYYRTPSQWRQWLVNYVRSGSTEHKQKKSINIMDVNVQAIEQAFCKHDVKHMIHGHTHRPGHYSHNNAERIVLGDWYVDAQGQAVGNMLVAQGTERVLTPI